MDVSPAASGLDYRIAIVGTSGVGKTTLARQISQRLNIPHVELDVLNWEPGWTPAPLEVFQSRVTNALAGPSWVVDGNYSKVQALIWQQAKTIVWLDYALPIVLSRVIRRTVHRIVMQTELWNGNREHWSQIFRGAALLERRD
jgi:adenylate kinase family enzyme